MTIQNKRKCAYVVSRLISRGVPLISVFFIYGLVKPEEDPKLQLVGMSMISIAVVIGLFYKDVKDKAKAIYNTQWKYAMEESKYLVYSVILLLFIQWAKSGLFEIEKLVFVIMISQLVAIYPASLHRRYIDLDPTLKKEDN